MNTYHIYKAVLQINGKEKSAKTIRKSKEEAHADFMASFPQAERIEIKTIQVNDVIAFEENRIENMKLNLEQKMKELIKQKMTLVDYKHMRNRLLKNNLLKVYRVKFFSEGKREFRRMIAATEQELLLKLKEMYILEGEIEFEILNVDFQIKTVEELMENLQRAIDQKLETISLRGLNLLEWYDLKRKQVLLNQKATEQEGSKWNF